MSEYADRDPRELEPHFSKHMSAMTSEGLHSKAAIAEELAYRDVLIDKLTKIAKAADLVASMSSYDEDADEVDPCHMTYFEELEAALIPWRVTKGGNDR